MSIREFSIQVPQPTLDDLQIRLAGVRWPSEAASSDWQRGASLSYMKDLIAYWRTGYDWRAQEKLLNGFAQFQAGIDGNTVHFIYQKAKTGEGKRAVILSHGWPDSFYRWYKLIPMLTDPERFGGKASDALDVVAPSLPGYGFSSAPAPRQAGTAHSAELVHKLMTEELGYKNYFAAGGDFGGQVTRLLALKHPESVSAIHLTDIGYSGDPVFPAEIDNPSPEEQAYLGANQGWFYNEGAYSMIQGTKPMTLSYGLSDSPVGLAAWIIEKFYTWSDCNGDIESRYTKDELLTNVMLYWVTQTVESSIRVYSENGWQSLLVPGQKIHAAAALARFPKDLGITPPRSIAERSLDIRRWTEMPTGGHFAALEEPELLARDMREFFRDFESRQG